MIAISAVIFLLVRNSSENNANNPARIKSKQEWIETFKSNRDEFTAIAKQFSEQDLYANIQLQKGSNRTTCDYESADKCEAYGLGRGDSNLYESGIALDSSDRYAQFMKKHYIMSLSTENYKLPGSDVSFTSGDFGKCGLAYIESESSPQIDSELTVVDQIEDHWFYICQDWN